MKMTAAPRRANSAAPRQSTSPDFRTQVRWNALSKYGVLTTRFVSSIVLARLLLPEDFGLMGMAMVVSGFAASFQDAGFGVVIVQRKILSHRLLSTLFWATLGFCTLLAATLAASASLIGYAFQDDRVPRLIRLLSINFILTGFLVVPAALLRRRMEFRWIAIGEILASLAGAATAITLASRGGGPISLAFGGIVGIFTRTTIFTLAARFVPAWAWDTRGFIDCARFGLNVSGFNVVNYWCRNADNLVVGSFLGPVALGLYSLAYRFVLLPIECITNVVTGVLFPKLSRIQDDDPLLSNLYLRACGTVALLTFPAMAGIALLADPLIRVAVGEKWLPATPVVSICALVGAIQSVSSISGQLYYVKGRANVLLRWYLVATAILLSSFLVGISWGVTGVAAAYAVATIIVVIPTHLIAFSFVDTLHFSALLSTLRPHAVATALMALAVVGVYHFSQQAQFSPIPQLLMSVPTGIVTYAALALRMNTTAKADLLSMLPRLTSAPSAVSRAS